VAGGGADLGRVAGGLLLGGAGLWVLHQALFSALVAALALGAPGWLAEGRNGPLHLGLDLALAGVVVVGARPLGPTGWRRVGAALLALTLALDLALVASSHLGRTRELEREADRLDVLLPPEARLGEALGPTFALLTGRAAARQRAPRPGVDFAPGLASVGTTHLVVDGQHRGRLGPHESLLTPVWAGEVGGEVYYVARVRASLERAPPTPLEAAILAAAAARVGAGRDLRPEARALFELWAEGGPR